MGQAGLAEVGSRGPPVDSAARSGSWDGIPECQISEGRYVRAHTHKHVCVCVCVCMCVYVLQEGYQIQMLGG